MPFKGYWEENDRDSKMFPGRPKDAKWSDESVQYPDTSIYPETLHDTEAHAKWD